MATGVRTTEIVERMEARVFNGPTVLVFGESRKSRYRLPNELMRPIRVMGRRAGRTAATRAEIEALSCFDQTRDKSRNFGSSSFISVWDTLRGSAALCISTNSLESPSLRRSHLYHKAARTARKCERWGQAVSVLSWGIPEQ